MTEKYFLFALVLIVEMLEGNVSEIGCLMYFSYNSLARDLDFLNIYKN